MQTQRDAATRILVVASTWWAAPARLAVALERVGCRVAAVCPPGHPLLHVSAVKQHYRYRWQHPVRSLKLAIDASRPDLVLPTDDRCVGHLQALHRDAGPAMQAMLQRSLGHAQRFAVVQSRFAVLDMAERLGIRVPATRRLASVRDLDDWDAPLPWIVKSSGTWGGAGVQTATDAAACRAAFERLARPVDMARAVKRWTVNRDGFSLEPWLKRRRPEIIAQRFVPGRPANIAVACWDGAILASLAVEALRTQGPLGATTVGRVIASPEMTEAARRIVGTLGLSGLHGLDFVLDDADRPWLIEMNPRATQLCHFARSGGGSLAHHLVARLRGAPAPDHPPAPPDTLIALFPQAWFAQPQDPPLATALHDVPWEEPALIRELIGAPWPNRSWMARLWQTHIRPQPWDAWTGASASQAGQADTAATLLT